MVLDKVFTSRRADKKEGIHRGATHTRLKDFNPTSRPQIAWVLQHIHGMTFTKLTEKGKPQVNRDSLEELSVLALQQGKPEVAASIEDFLHLLDLQKWMGQLSEGDNSWLNMVNETTGASTTAACSAPRPDATPTSLPTLVRPTNKTGQGSCSCPTRVR